MALTAPVQAFLDEAWDARSRPLLRTGQDAHLSWFISDELRRRGGRWMVTDADGIDHDAHSGLPVEAAAASRAARLPVADAAPPSCLALTFDVKIREQATMATTCGRVAEFMVDALGGGQLAVMDPTEPLGQYWSTSELTVRLRGEMPLSRRHLARSIDGAIVSIQVKRTSEGIVEHTRGVVPVLGRQVIDQELTGMVEEALTVLNSRFRVNSASSAVTTVELLDGRLGHCARPRKADLPVALLFGPALVRDLRLNLEEVGQRFQAFTVGLSKVPALVVPLAEDPGRYRAFAEHIDGEVFRGVLRDAFDWDAPRARTDR